MRECVKELAKDNNLETDQVYPYQDDYSWAQVCDYGRSGGEDEDEREEICFERTTHKLLTNLPRFLVAKNGIEVPGWRLATYSEVKACYEMVKSYIGRERQWYICRLQDGRIAGVGYNYEMQTIDSKDLGHQLLIQYPCSFSIIKSGKLLTGWRLATYNEVETNLDLVKALLRDKKAKYVCLVQGGKIHGADEDFLLERGMFMGLQHQIVVKYDSKSALNQSFKSWTLD